MIPVLVGTIFGFLPVNESSKTSAFDLWGVALDVTCRHETTVYGIVDVKARNALLRLLPRKSRRTRTLTGWLGRGMIGHSRTNPPVARSDLVAGKNPNTKDDLESIGKLEAHFGTTSTRH